jgi:hypothetical protein
MHALAAQRCLVNLAHASTRCTESRCMVSWTEEHCRCTQVALELAKSKMVVTFNGSPSNMNARRSTWGWADPPQQRYGMLSLFPLGSIDFFWGGIITGAMCCAESVLREGFMTHTLTRPKASAQGFRWVSVFCTEEGHQSSHPRMHVMDIA